MCATQCLPGTQFTCFTGPKVQILTAEELRASLSAWSAHIAGDTLIKYLPVALTVESPAGREDAFKWAADYLSARNKSEVCAASNVSKACSKVSKQGQERGMLS